MTKDAINKKYDSMRGDPGAAFIWYINDYFQFIYRITRSFKTKDSKPQMSKFGTNYDKPSGSCECESESNSEKVTTAASDELNGRRAGRK